MAAELEELLVADPVEWRAWLEEHHADSPGVWLILTKKGGTKTTMTWAYAPPSEAVVPDDLAAAIAADPAAQAMFEVLTKTNRYPLIHRLGQAKLAETRER